MNEKTQITVMKLWAKYELFFLKNLIIFVIKKPHLLEIINFLE
jgi:hypothetical protein